MRCPRCHQLVPDDVRYCPNDGYSFKTLKARRQKVQLLLTFFACLAIGLVILDKVSQLTPSNFEVYIIPSDAAQEPIETIEIVSYASISPTLNMLVVQSVTPMTLSTPSPVKQPISDSTSVPTARPTLRPTYTSTARPTSLPTRTSVRRPTIRPTPLTIATATDEVPCPGALPTRIRVGMRVRVIAGLSPNTLKSEPTQLSTTKFLMDGGSELEVLGGPECQNNFGYRWWYVRFLEENTRGWTVEGDRTTYWLEPVRNR
jgi:hypothetical protein